MASEGLEGELAAVLGGQGLRVHSCDSEPAGELLAPVRLRRNVCYVVLAVCLNEQVSVHPPAPTSERATRPWGQRTYRQLPPIICGRRFPVLQSTVTLTSEPGAPKPAIVRCTEEKPSPGACLSRPTRPQFLVVRAYSSPFSQNLASTVPALVE